MQCLCVSGFRLECNRCAIWFYNRNDSISRSTREALSTAVGIEGAVSDAAYLRENKVTATIGVGAAVAEPADPKEVHDSYTCAQPVASVQRVF